LDAHDCRDAGDRAMQGAIAEILQDDEISATPPDRMASYVLKHELSCSGVP